MNDRLPGCGSVFRLAAGPMQLAFLSVCTKGDSRDRPWHDARASACLAAQGSGQYRASGREL
jgi:hypothetical protein